MTAQEYILNRLKGINSKPVEPSSDLADFIFKSIMSKKFRKFSIPELAAAKIHEAIELNLKSNEPIKIALPFGSYKLWRFEESPEVDWAEWFAMIYYAYWLKPICDVYQPGVWFDFCADDAILELMNNIPEADTEKYRQGFRSLIEFLQPYLPKNFKFTLSPVSERYSTKEEFLADLNEQINKLKQSELPPIDQEQIDGIKQNVRVEPGTVIDFEKNRILHDAYMNVSKRRPHHKRPDKIVISSTPFGSRTSLPVGTTKTSVVQFQVGVGVLKQIEEAFIEYIYSPSQLIKGKFDWQKIEIEGLSGKNFKKIRIFE